MSDLEPVEGLDTLPRPIFLEGEREPIPDPDGFILPIGMVLSPQDLLQQSAVLVVAPPWTGKTTVAEGMARALEAHPFFELTCFEKRERGARVEPAWWEDWKAGDGEAVWVVDGLDEDARKDRQSFKILQLLRESGGARARLHLIVFCRTNEIPRWFEDGLEALCSTWSPEHPLGLRRLRLAGLDRETARAHVGLGHFDRVCRLIRGNDLQALAPLPAALRYLVREGGESLTRADVWEGVLKDLLREKRDDPDRPSFRAEVEDRFAVSRKLAALATFCGIEPVQPDAGLERVFPETVHGFAELRVAAREAWKTSVFELSDRGYRFSQDHVRQWLTAFALQKMALPQLRPLLSRDDGTLEPAHEGVVGLLAQISDHEEVRGWLVEAHGGLPGAGDTTWSLADAARALDKLQDIARSSPWGLSIWREERLRSFRNVPGIGVEIARRLELDLHPAEQQLLLDLTLVIDAPEPVALAARILQDPRGDERARERAASLVAALGTAEQLEPLAVWLEGMEEEPEKAVASPLEVAFYDKGIWSFEKAFEEGGRICNFLGRSPTARRRLFLEGMRHDPQCQGESRWVWRNVLNGEDAEWLLDLFLGRQDQPAALWEGLYNVAHYQKAIPPELFRRMRQELHDADAEKLESWDQERESWIEAEQEIQRRTRSEASITYELEPLVRETLDSEEFELRHKMYRLSWCCFEPSDQRPRNVTGRWQELPATLRGQVMGVCRHALSQCSPTPIPESSSYSRWTSWEAACFDRLVQEDSGFVLTSEMIRKWLPALLRDWVSGSGYEPTLRRCFEVDRQLAEDLFSEGVRRAVLAEKSTYVLQNLPPGLWSERFSSLLEALVTGAEVAPEMQIDLMVRISWAFPARAQPIAQGWAAGSAGLLQEAGIDLLLMVAPEEGWRHLKALTERENPKDVLLRMRSLLPHHYGPSAVFDSWPAEQLAGLEELLLACHPPEADPQWEEGQVRSLGEEDDLRSVRDHIPQVLYRRDREGDHAALEALAARHRHLRDWLDDVRAQQGAESVISSLGRSTRPPGEGRRVPPADLLKLLQSAEHRLLGSVDDLQDVLLEELGRIARDAGQHLSMLYRPKPSRGGRRERLHEDALQAYLACRLADRLPRILEGRGLKIEPSVDREPLADRNSRNDIKVQAPSSIDGARLTVIVEVKWSDNGGVSTNLVDQLGEGYLLRNNLTHGIYLVGWSGDGGTWKENALGAAPQSRSSRDAWQKALEEQAELFCQAHPGLRVRPLVMDLAWEPATG